MDTMGLWETLRVGAIASLYVERESETLSSSKTPKFL
jgi:hypothetical protein